MDRAANEARMAQIEADLAASDPKHLAQIIAASAERASYLGDIESLRQALAAHGTTNWHDHNFRTREAAAKALWRAEPGRWRVCENGTVRRHRTRQNRPRWSGQRKTPTTPSATP